MDIRVLEAQQWLNENYGNNPLFDRQEEDGVVTTLVMMGLVEALQIELNIGSVTGIFGNQTLAACPTLKLGDTGNIVRILQHGLFCKGYDPGLDYGNFDSQTEQAIRDMQTDAGLIGAMQHEYVSPILFQAILSMEWYKLVSNGDPVIREMQQTYNYYYQDWNICLQMLQTEILAPLPEDAVRISPMMEKPWTTSMNHTGMPLSNGLHSSSNMLCTATMQKEVKKTAFRPVFLMGNLL